MLLTWTDFKKGKTAEDCVVKDAPNPFQKLNEATIEDLCEIKGIGQKTSEKVLSGAPYQSEEQLREGLSAKIADKILDWLGLQ